MNDPIPDPLSGKHVLDWAVPVTRSLNGLRDKAGATARNERDRRAANKPLPYEVRFDATLDSGDGGWKIYLPTEHLLSYDGVDVDTSDIAGITAIEDANGDVTGWYSFDDIDLQDDHVWLVITITDPASGSSSPTVEAEFAASEGQASTGEKVVNVCIAEVSYTAPSQSGDPATIEIKQSVVGALHLGGGASALASGTVVMSVDYVTSSDDDDFATHPYAIRIKRGTLANINGVVQPVEDPLLKQFIDTVAHTASMDATSGSSAS